MKYSIYCLKEPNSNIVRYVGFSYDISKRFKKHLCEKGTTRKHNWILSLKKTNMIPELELIEDGLNRVNALEKEIFYIKLFKSCGADLTNLTLGGDGVTMTKEIREKNK